MPRQENAESPGELAENQSKPRGQREALFVVAGSQLLVLTLWFSASAAAPQLEADWGLTSGEMAGLTLAVQIGFVLGAIGSAIFAIADVIPARRLFLVSSLLGAGANVALLALGPGDVELAFFLRLTTGLALAGVYPSGLKVMSGWFRRGRGMALDSLSGHLRLEAQGLISFAGSVSVGAGVLGGHPALR